MKKVRVLVVDDAALIRSMLTEILNSHPNIEVVGTAVDPFDAREKIKLLNPDVITLDIEMPKMNGLSFLKNLMRLRPMPVLMVSTLTQAGAPATLEALELGAVDFVPKPQNHSDMSLSDYRDDLTDKVLAAAKARLRSFPNQQAVTPKVGVPAGRQLRKGYICTIGASTGGTEAIKEVLTRLPAECPPIVIAQHIPAGFSLSFAKRMDKICSIAVHEAEDGQPIRPGNAYIAPGDFHLVVEKTASGPRCRLLSTERVNRHRPSVEVLFKSVQEVFGAKALSILLTGMGADGAQALLALRNAGAMTVAQDEESSVVWGMPKAAIQLGGAAKVLPLERIAAYIMHHAYSE